MVTNRQIKELCGPIFVEQFVAVLITMLSTMMMLYVSEAATSGVGLVNTINLLVMSVFSALSTGVTVAVAHYIGSGHRIEAGHTASHALTLIIYTSTLLGVLLALFCRPLLRALFPGSELAVMDAAAPYLIYSALSLPLLAVHTAFAGIMRAAGNSRTPMTASIFSNIGYAAVSLPCVYLLHMGVQGASLGLLASRLIPAAYLTVKAQRGWGLYIPKPPLLPNIKCLRPALSVALPAGLDSLIFQGGKLVVQIFISGMGTAVLAANQLGNALATLLNLPGMTLQLVTVTAAGWAYGAGHFAEARRHTLRLTWLCCLAEAALALPMLIFLDPIIGLYNASAEAARITRQIMLLVLITTPVLWGPAFVTPYGMRAMGDARFAMMVSIASMIALRILAAWLLGVQLQMGLFGVWLAMCLDWVGRAACFLFRMRTLKQKDLTQIISS